MSRSKTVELASPPHCPTNGQGDGEAAVAAATDEQRIEFQWKAIQRFDYYIGTTNTKAAIF
jgi:hypothetical protein